MPCCGINTENGAPAGAGGISAFVGTAYELDFSDQGNVSLTAGDHVIDGNTWTSVISATDTLDLTNGSGMQFVASANSSTFNTSSQTASHLYIPLSTLYTLLACDMRAQMMFEIYASALNLTGTAQVTLALYGPSGTPTGSGSRMSGSQRAIAAATQVWKTMSGTTFGSNYPQPNTNVWGFMNNGASGNDIHGFALDAAWGGSWPDSYDVAMNGQTNDQFDPLRHPDSRLGIAFPVNTLGTTTATIERIRITAWQPQAVA